MKLPTKRNTEIAVNPKLLTIFGKPKQGKTNIIEGLEDCLHLDFEDGAKFVKTLSISIKSFKDIVDLAKLLREKMVEDKSEFAYTYGVIDTATIFEEMLLPRALQVYRKTPGGSTFGLKDDGKYDNSISVLTAPHGGGYGILRDVFFSTLSAFYPLFKHIIVFAHTKEKDIIKKAATLTTNEIDLTGKTGKLLAAKSDAVGYMYRNEYENIIDFKGGSDLIIESRTPHLRNQTIVIAESDPENQGEDLEITTYWDKIFKPEITKTEKQQK